MSEDETPLPEASKRRTIQVTPTSTKKGLGRGLSALLGDEAADLKALERLRGGAREVPIEFLVSSALQPRDRFDSQEIAALAQSIRSHGILQPILVRPTVPHPEQSPNAEQYEIVAGERRWRAAQEASLDKVPVVIREFSDFQALEIAIIENVQREDLTPIEEAKGYRRLLEEFKRTQSDLAKMIGRSRSHVANTVRLLNLPEPVQQMMQRGELTAGHGRALLSADDPLKRAQDIVAGKLNVRTTEKLGRKASRGIRSSGKSKDANIRALEHDLSDALGFKVDIEHAANGTSGYVRINYRTLDQLDDIVHRLLSPRGRP